MSVWCLKTPTLLLRLKTSENLSSATHSLLSLDLKIPTLKNRNKNPTLKQLFALRDKGWGQFKNLVRKNLPQFPRFAIQLALKHQRLLSFLSLSLCSLSPRDDLPFPSSLLFFLDPLESLPPPLLPPLLR